MASTTLDYLLPRLRLKLGDTDPLKYRYVDEWLITSLLSAIISLRRWWYDKYDVDETLKEVSRNLLSTIEFSYDEPPVILQSDETPIILMAAILIKSGAMENNSWSLGSWRDTEVSVSNIEGGRAKEASLRMDWEELKGYLLPPTKRLSHAVRISPPDN